MSGLVPRPGIMDIAPYVPGESRAPDAARLVKLSANEGALGPSPGAIKAYRAAASDLHRYPDGDSGELRRAIAARHGLNPGKIVCGAGSDDLLTLLVRGYSGPGDEVLFGEHAFVMYPLLAMSVGATPVKAPEKDFTLSVDALLGKVTERTRIVLVANPNNPTGTMIDAGEMARLRAGLPDNVLLVIDAAYAEYVLRNDYSPGVDLVDEGENVVMTRTFSKIYALGGLRLGWVYCPEAIVDVLERIRSPFNVCSAAQAAGVAAVGDVEFLTRSRDHNTAWLPWLSGRLAEAGIDVVPSAGNFVLARFPATPGRTAADAMAFLSARGIVARSAAGAGIPDAVRITIGLEDEMRATADAVAEFMGAG